MTASDGVADLHALLASADVRGPYVIVGHSYGGLIARLYASTFPDAVAGVVLEDALSEGLYDGLTAQQREILEAINLEPERVDTVRSFAQVTSAPPVRTMPMVVLTADLPPISPEDVASGALPPFVTTEFVAALWTAQVAAQDRLARLFPVRPTHHEHQQPPLHSRRAAPGRGRRDPRRRERGSCRGSPRRHRRSVAALTTPANDGVRGRLRQLLADDLRDRAGSRVERREVRLCGPPHCRVSVAGVVFCSPS